MSAGKIISILLATKDETSEQKVQELCTFNVDKSFILPLKNIFEEDFYIHISNLLSITFDFELDHCVVS